jgi:voltage-gated potassium channel
MEKQPAASRPERWMERRIERRGLRPRDAAYVIAAFWAVAVIVFGVLERIVDPKTYHSVWLGMWWAVETVTTVGYGDVVPDQTAGKVIAGFLMLGGLSLLAVLIAAVTSGFVSRAQAQAQDEQADAVAKRLDELFVELQAVRAELEQLRADQRPGSASERHSD